MTIHVDVNFAVVFDEMTSLFCAIRKSGDDDIQNLIVWWIFSLLDLHMNELKINYKKDSESFEHSCSYFDKWMWF